MIYSKLFYLLHNLKKYRPFFPATKITIIAVIIILVFSSLVNNFKNPIAFTILTATYILLGSFFIYFYKRLAVKIINNVNEHRQLSSRFFPTVNFQRKSIEGMDVFSLTEKYGSPSFVISTEKLLKRLKNVKKIMNSKNIRYQLAYSVKTNNLLYLAKIYRKNGLLAEVASGEEYRLARKAGYQGSKIIFNGPYKIPGDLKQAIKDKALVVIDNSEELRLINSLSKQNINVGIRLNTGVFNNSRFGFSIEDGNALKAVRFIAKNKNLILSTLHFHLGSNIPSPVYFKHAAKKVLEFIRELRKIGIKIKTVDIGGGFPTIGSGIYSSIIPYTFNDFIDPIAEEISEYPEILELILEPGRLLVDESCVLLTKVVSVKAKNGISNVTVDSSVNIFPLSNRYQLMCVLSKKNSVNGHKTLTNIYGASCMENDKLVEKRILEKIRVGDILVFFNAGAYNISQSRQFIFGRPATLGIEEGKVSILRKREKAEDFYRLDL